MKEKENSHQYLRPIAFAVLVGTVFNFFGLMLMILKWGGVDYWDYVFGNLKPGLVWFCGGAVIGSLLAYISKPKA